MRELNLFLTTAYTVRASTDEYKSQTKGVYSTYSAANVNCKGAGWYGSDGHVETMEGVYTDGVKLYQVRCLGEFTDKEVEQAEKMMANIKAKLTPEEWEFYNQNIKR